jgi:hypothetical protein
VLRQVEARGDAIDGNLQINARIVAGRFPDVGVPYSRRIA